MKADIPAPSDQLISFCRLLNESKKLQSQVKQAKTANQIIKIAESNGVKISHEELRFWSKELMASYFPWAEMGDVWRRNFFGKVV